jgi:hypothetical protein
MPFTSMDDIVNKISSGNFKRTDWQKSFLPTTPAVGGEWHYLARGAGNPQADAIMNTGTNLVFQPLSDTTANVNSILHGGPVSPNYKHVTVASAFTAAATVAPCILMLVDTIGFYRVTSVTTTTAQTVTNNLAAFSTFTADAGTDIITHTNINLMHLSRVQVSTTTTLPAGLSAATDYYVIKVSDLTCQLATSYANALAGTAINITDAGTGTHTINTLYPRHTNGAGVQAFMYANNATPLGAGTPNLSITYTNTAAVTGRVTPTVLPIGKTAAANGLVLYSGTGAGKVGPFLPLRESDAGVERITAVQNSTTYTSGEYSVVVCKPILTLPITTLGVMAEREFLNQLPSLPRIYDGACLNWMIYSGGNTPTNSAIYGHLDFAWG